MTTRVWFALVDSNYLPILATTICSRRNSHSKRQSDKSLRISCLLQHEINLSRKRQDAVYPNKLRFQSFAFSSSPNQTKTSSIDACCLTIARRITTFACFPKSKAFVTCRANVAIRSRSTQPRRQKLSQMNSKCNFFSIILLLLCASLASASDQRSLRDQVFALQGEYVGRYVVDGDVRYAGLQVVADGLGSFDAWLLDGGLPGAGWNGEGRVKFSGGGIRHIILSSSESSLQIKHFKQYPQLGFCIYLDGYRIGNLTKVQRGSPTMHLTPPSNAIVLFNGIDEPRLKDAKVNPNGTLGIGAETIDTIQNARIHVEFKTPFDPEKSGQSRGNSGVYIQRRYEVQILDSFGLDLEPNRCGGLYRQKSADINMAYPPESWQTYDIYFYAAKFDATGKRINKARITVMQNGVIIHNNYELVNKTGAGRKETPEPGPIWFQNHGDPVEFRNLWMVPLGDNEVLPSDAGLGFFNNTVVTDTRTGVSMADQPIAMIPSTSYSSQPSAISSPRWTPIRRTPLRSIFRRR